MDAPVPALEPVLPRRHRGTGRVRRRVVAAALVVLVLAFAAYLAWQLTRPTLPAVGARIAVIDPRGQLVTMERNGGSATAFEVPGVTFQFPAWSPDGTRIAAVGIEGDEGSVYVLSATEPTAEVEAIYTSDEQRPFYLSWSPDATHVTFLTNQADGIGLRIAPADGSAPATLIRRGAPLYWDWVDPARLLVHTGSGGPDAFLGEVDLEGTTLDAPSDRPGYFRAPAVSVAGSHRAWIGPGNDGGQAIVVEARDGSGRNEVPVEGSAAISFDPTGTALAFIASDRAVVDPPPLPIGPLRTVDSGSGAVRTLIDGPVMAFFWSPDGRTLAAIEFIDPDDVGPGEAQVGGRLAATDAAAAAEPSGLAVRLVFVDVATGERRSDREVRVTDLFAFQVLPFFDQYARSHRLWSPDGAAVVLPIADPGEPDRLVVLDADGGDAVPLADGSIGFWSP